MKLLLMVSTIALVHCRPQTSAEQEADSIQTGEKPIKVTLLDYYGGAKGNTLQVLEMPDGRTVTNIIRTNSTQNSLEEVTDAAPDEIENPDLPQNSIQKNDSDYSESISNIHKTAINIIRLQEAAKNRGGLSEEEQKVYEENLDSLNLSAQNLAAVQEESDYQDSYSGGTLQSWFDRKKANKVKKEEEKKQGGNKGNEEVDKDETDENEDGVAINLPPEDASVAEAKPVGLAVAGVGGVAASKPIATAVVGPGGLAIARPVGTAIAGVSPDQALVPIYAEGFIGARPNPPKKESAASEYLNKLINKYHNH